MPKVQPIAGNDVVDTLVRLTEIARQGRLDEIAFVGIGSIQIIGHVGTSSDPARLLGMLTKLGVDMAAAMDVVEP